MCAPTNSQRRWNIDDDEDGDDAPIEPRISHWLSSAATKHRQAGRQTGITSPTRVLVSAGVQGLVAGWLAGVSLLMGRQLTFGTQEGNQNKSNSLLAV
jgi:hypothetical protein